MIFNPPRPDVELKATPPDQGCTYPECGTQLTETLSPYVGRRCAAHPPEDPPRTAQQGDAA